MTARPETNKKNILSLNEAYKLQRGQIATLTEQVAKLNNTIIILQSELNTVKALTAFGRGTGPTAR